MTRHFLADDDLTPLEQTGVLDLAARFKSHPFSHRPLAGPATVALLFDKPSTRTRVSFAVGVGELGGIPLVLDAATTQLGRGETLADTARVLDRQVAAVVWRTFSQHGLEQLAASSSVPVVNGLSDLLHPCQLLADLLTVWEEFGGWDGRIVAWVGDGNNMANSWLNTAALLGFELRLACPEGYEPNHEIFEAAKKAATVSIVEDPDEAVRGAHVVTTDVWASMGQEADAEARRLAFKGDTVESKMMGLAADDAIFLHCLPAHRGEEVAAEVIDGPQSRVFDQAENRLHAQKALVARLMG